MRYTIEFYFDDLDFFISYDGFAKNESIYRMCPQFPPKGNLDGEIRIYTKSPGLIPSLFTVIKEIGGNIPDYPGYLILDKATGISIDELYEMYLNNDEVCFETLKDIWS